MNERPLCPTCGAYWNCGHPWGFLAGIPVFIDEEQEEPIRFLHRGPVDAEWCARVDEAMKILREPTS